MSRRTLTWLPIQKCSLAANEKGRPGPPLRSRWLATALVWRSLRRPGVWTLWPKHEHLHDYVNVHVLTWLTWFLLESDETTMETGAKKEAILNLSLKLSVQINR